MSVDQKAYVGVGIFDGSIRHNNHALLIEGCRVKAILPEACIEPSVKIEKLSDGLLIPGFVDLQVNGGGGVMFNDDPSLHTLRRIAKAHAKLGSTSILPTLITDTPEKTRAAIEAVSAAITVDVPGILGLHLEGPHLAVSKCGAHDPSLIRPMTDQDVQILLSAAQKLPVVMITIAPESVTPDQVSVLVNAGVTVSIGHSDATYNQVKQTASAGATCITHLFNAMRQMTSREPGVVGAALDLGELSAGLIADGIHVHPATIRCAYKGKKGPNRLFLVSDAMAVAGTRDDQFKLGGRIVSRSDGRLLLEDGTLAGADLNLLTAVRNIIRWKVAKVDAAIAMATAIPADTVSLANGTGRLVPGGPADFQFLPENEQFDTTVWQKGRKFN